MTSRMIAGTRLAIIAGALLVAGLGVGVTMIDSPSLGVEAEAPGDVVQHVLPGGPAWRSGIREGQRVELLDDTDPDTWTLETSSGPSGFAANVPAYRLELASAWPLGLLGVGLALVALVLHRVRPTFAIPAAVVGAAIGTEVALRSSDPLLSSAAVIAACGLTAAALATSTRRRSAVALSIAMVMVGVAWVVARFAVPTAFDLADATRRASYAAAGGLLVLVSVPLEPRGWLSASRAVSAFDVLFAAGLATAGILLWRVVELPPAALAGVVASSVVAYALVRGIVGRIVDRLVIADTREQSRILAIEEERQRLARELHDEPLQRLAGVIKDLERDGGSPGETSVLMEIADDLRSLATNLRPPALDDLGLVPALTGLAASGPPRVRVELDDRTGYDSASRLPADVELALYRIAAEAIRNAVQHSGGTQVTVTGVVAPDRAAIVIADDGRGIDDVQLRTRRRDGHLGMSTMRQRATLAGATLAIDTSAAGVRVRLGWERR